MTSPVAGSVGPACSVHTCWRLNTVINRFTFGICCALGRTGWENAEIVMILKCAHIMWVFHCTQWTQTPVPWRILFSNSVFSFHFPHQGPIQQTVRIKAYLRRLGSWSRETADKLCCNSTADALCVYSVDSSSLLHCITQHSSHRRSTVMTH